MNSQQERATQLHLLIQCGADIETIQDLISQGADVKGRDGIGSTPLHRAVVRADESIVKLLISAGVDVNAQDFENGAAPLHIACQKSCYDISKVLLDNGADSNIVSNSGDVAASYPVFQANSQLFSLLLEYGFDLKAKLRHPLVIWAAMSRKISMVQLLIDASCNVNEGDYEDWTALHAATVDNSLEMVIFLLANGADVYARCRPFNGTPLFYACAMDEENFEVVQTLINSGSDVNARDNSGRTPYYMARDKGNDVVCELLTKHGAIASRLTIVATSKRLIVPSWH